MPEGDRRHRWRRGVGGGSREVGIVLGQAPADLDDRLAQLDGAFPADVLTGPGSPGRLVQRRDKARGPVRGRRVREPGLVADPGAVVRGTHHRHSGQGGEDRRRNGGQDPCSAEWGPCRRCIS